MEAKVGGGFCVWDEGPVSSDITKMKAIKNYNG